jgi:hypothetical protein
MAIFLLTMAIFSFSAVQRNTTAQDTFSETSSGWDFAAYIEASQPEKAPP